MCYNVVFSKIYNVLNEVIYSSPYLYAYMTWNSVFQFYSISLLMIVNVLCNGPQNLFFLSIWNLQMFINNFLLQPSLLWMPLFYFLVWVPFGSFYRQLWSCIYFSAWLSLLNKVFPRFFHHFQNGEIHHWF